MYHVSGETCLEAWKEGCNILIEQDYSLFNLVTTIENPKVLDEEWISTYNPRSFIPKSNGTSLSDVINTIFPRRLVKERTRDELYKYYLEVDSRRSRLGNQKKDRWGTYFRRMICFGDDANNNQLETIIKVLNNEDRWFRTTNPIHISSADYDSLAKRLGNPCLQYLQFVQPVKGTLDLVVVYRNHDFFEKALGNFIGLGQLLDFVANATDTNAGKLICHSVRAYSDHKGPLEALARLNMQQELLFGE
ncbi:MAG: hypothetical protein AAF821_19055 [Cyanobacteria bacterium P01_D01_bin.156]